GQPSESKLSLNAAKAEDHEFDLSLITSSKDKKNNIYLCIKGSFRKEEWSKTEVVGKIMFIPISL
ncbi:hypothetical protein NXH77_11970, partial [Bacteroides thetaiotaomicron]|uniref:hypothetical protein n=1 Tax=Bacteroides thetaiotaomicron TaxID=818 RepID=UPI00234E8EA7